jgi:hypothetical protein
MTIIKVTRAGAPTYINPEYIVTISPVGGSGGCNITMTTGPLQVSETADEIFGKLSRLEQLDMLDSDGRE